MFKWMATLLVLIFTFQFSSISHAETDDSLKVNRDFIWNTNQLLTVSRSKENNTTTDTAERSFPALFQVNLLNQKQQQITNPPAWIAGSDGTVLGEPSYAKWGQLAMREVGKKYNARIIDYLHVGRTQINAQTTKETFKFWLRGENREFGVYVTIRFETSTDKVLSVVFQESDR